MQVHQLATPAAPSKDQIERHIAQGHAEYTHWRIGATTACPGRGAARHIYAYVEKQLCLACRWTTYAVLQEDGDLHHDRKSGDDSITILLVVDTSWGAVLALAAVSKGVGDGYEASVLRPRNDRLGRRRRVRQSEHDHMIRSLANAATTKQRKESCSGHRHPKAGYRQPWRSWRRRWARTPALVLHGYHAWCVVTRQSEERGGRYVQRREHEDAAGKVVRLVRTSDMSEEGQSYQKPPWSSSPKRPASQKRVPPPDTSGETHEELMEEPNPPQTAAEGAEDVTPRAGAAMAGS